MNQISLEEVVKPFKHRNQNQTTNLRRVIKTQQNRTELRNRTRNRTQKDVEKSTQQEQRRITAAAHQNPEQNFGNPRNKQSVPPINFSFSNETQKKDNRHIET